MARRITDLGHEAKLIYTQFVPPFVKSNKKDFVDAEAICEVAFRPSMRFVKPRSLRILVIHCARSVMRCVKNLTKPGTVAEKARGPARVPENHRNSGE